MENVREAADKLVARISHDAEKSVSAEYTKHLADALAVVVDIKAACRDHELREAVRQSEHYRIGY